VRRDVAHICAVARSEVDVQRAEASRALSKSSTVDPMFFLAGHEVHGASR
jgi:hypothetical protein